MPEKRYAIIPARGNSKGIPGKNLYPVAGRPLLFYTINAALDSNLFDEIIVSSESKQVLAYADKMGVSCRKRPIKLSSDNTHSIYVVLDCIKSKNISLNSIVSMLLPTAPLRTAMDLRKSMEVYEKGDADSLISVYLDNKHILNLRHIDEDGYLKQIINGQPNVQRQELNPLYVVNGSIYISTAKILLKKKSFHISRAIPYIMQRKYSVDINNPEDIHEVERLIKECS